MLIIWGIGFIVSVILMCIMLKREKGIVFVDEFLGIIALSLVWFVTWVFICAIYLYGVMRFYCE